MHTLEFLDELVLLCLAALAVITVFQRVKLPPIIGLIATGLIIGPTGFGLVEQDAIIAAISELGIVLLLFTIGLEFSIDDMRKLKSIVFIGGPLQVLLSTVLTGTGAYFISQWAGSPIDLNGAILIGMAMAISSTAICTKLLADRKELHAPHGRAVLGILIFQDIAVVPMMIIVTMLSAHASTHPTILTLWVTQKFGGNVEAIDALARILTLVVVTGGLLFGMRTLMPRVMAYVTRTNHQEVLILGALGLCFSAAWITSIAGISMALGAFIAGMAIAGSEESHLLEKTLRPMRDAFTSVFFLSVGLLVNVNLVALPTNIGSALLVLLANAVVVAIILISLRMPIRTAIMAAMILAQVGEFSFLLISLGVDYDVISSTDFQNMLVAIIVTMIVTPTLVTIAPFVAERVVPLANAIPALRRWSMDDERGMIKLETADEERDKPMVVIVGGGVLGTHVAHVFKQTGITYRMVELNRDTVARLRERGEPILAGDITDVDTLEHAGVRDAAVVIVAINNTMALVRGVEVIRHMRPDVQIIVRSRYLQDCGAVREKGADLVIVEEFESSISVFTHVLAYLGAAPELIEQQEQRMRAQRGLIV